MGLFSRFKKNKKAEAPKATAPATPAKPAPAKPAAKAAAKPAAKAAKAAPAKKADEPKEYRPQCGAVAASGGQCRNSARAGSKYCGSHKGYQPPSKASVIAKKDTAPRASKAEDTLPGKKAAKAGDAKPQCAAITASGGQCKNSARGASKYCASHKGYKHATDAAKVKKADTKPRWEGAADTKPAVRADNRCAAKTQAGKRCARKPAGKSKYCASHKGYRA